MKIKWAIFVILLAALAGACGEMEEPDQEPDVGFDHDVEEADLLPVSTFTVVLHRTSGVCEDGDTEGLTTEVTFEPESPVRPVEVLGPCGGFLRVYTLSAKPTSINIKGFKRGRKELEMETGFDLNGEGAAVLYAFPETGWHKQETVQR